MEAQAKARRDVIGELNSWGGTPSTGAAISLVAPQPGGRPTSSDSALSKYRCDCVAVDRYVSDCIATL